MENPICYVILESIQYNCKIIYIFHYCLTLTYCFRRTLPNFQNYFNYYVMRIVLHPLLGVKVTAAQNA